MSVVLVPRCGSIGFQDGTWTLTAELIHNILLMSHLVTVDVDQIILYLSHYLSFLLLSYQNFRFSAASLESCPLDVICIAI